MPPTGFCRVCNDSFVDPAAGRGRPARTGGPPHNYAGSAPFQAQAGSWLEIHDALTQARSQVGADAVDSREQ